LHLLLWIRGVLSPQEIRDRILDPNSDFQKRMVEYLESVHAGEFQTGTREQVEAQVKEKQSSNDYQDPTQTLPVAPPPLCDSPGDECSDCRKLARWWKKFDLEVDDLVLKSNVHNCRRNQSSEKKDRPACINKHGNCKARFPREVIDQTHVDKETGAIKLRKGEGWINTFTPVVTFLLRCNTDVTSLLSGTAIKAVVAYISDYVTKPSLKTYSIFETIKSVFLRNSEMLGGSIERKEKGRRLITKIVNALTARMETGAPMASLYLLKNPDHYTNRRFNVVYWKNYVAEVSKAWQSSEDMSVDDHGQDKLVLLKSKGRYIGVSKVHDYVYRPEAHSDKTLYEWVQMATRVKQPPGTKANAADVSEDELNLAGPSEMHELMDFMGKGSSDIETDDMNLHTDDSESDIEEDNSLSDMDTDAEEEVFESEGEIFLEGHPLHETHLAQYDDRKHDWVPNFVGGSLPRRDRGDREFYCKTMLTLFKPWRSGKDLKAEDYSWDETFLAHDFTKDQLQLMANFNIRYECNDARDDFSTQMKGGKASGGMFPQWMTTEVTDEIDDFNVNGHGDDFGDDSGPDDDYGVSKYSALGHNGAKSKAEMEAAENSVKGAGWLDESPDGLYEVDTEPLVPEIAQSSRQWKAAVQDKRQEALAERNKNIPKIPARHMQHQTQSQ